MDSNIKTYEEAMCRLEAIVLQIENNQLSIDELGEKLKEAQELIAFCNEKLYKANREIRKILEQNERE